MNSRRTFIRIAPIAGLGILVSRHALAADLDPKDPQAAALGYVVDATKTDKAKSPKFAARQDCASCQLYQGKADAASGACTLFPGKPVAAKGWCSAWVKKA